MAVGALNLRREASTLEEGLGRVRWNVVGVGLLVSAVTSIVAVEALNAGAAASSRYTAARSQAESALHVAEQLGYSRAELSPVVGALADQPAYFSMPGKHARAYGSAAARLTAAVAQVPSLEAAALARHRDASATRLTAARAALDAAAAQGAEAADLDGVRADIDRIAADLAGVADPRAADRLGAAAGGLSGRAIAAGNAARAEQAGLVTAADHLNAQYGGNLEQLRAAGNASLLSGRNDATLGALLKVGTASHLAGRLEHYARLMAGSEPDQVALGVAGTQGFQQQIHDAVLAHLPRKTIVVSLAAQELWAFEAGRVVQDSLVTTGRPELPTDVGVMKVLSKDSPWKMHSPWPKGSPNWYPDTTVRKAVWFTVTGEALHDAAWQPVSTYGPGGQFTPSASHGCVHLPDAAENFIFDWAEPGTTVVVYPGDGAAASEQLKKVSVDADGVPLSGPKGS